MPIPGIPKGHPTDTDYVVHHNGNDWVIRRADHQGGVTIAKEVLFQSTTIRNNPHDRHQLVVHGTLEVNADALISDVQVQAQHAHIRDQKARDRDQTVQIATM